MPCITVLASAVSNLTPAFHTYTSIPNLPSRHFCIDIRELEGTAAIPGRVCHFFTPLPPP